jgi:hypothetical protein
MRNPWPIAITAVCVGFAAAMATFATFAMRHQDDLVRKDYYDHEIAYQQHMDRELEAAAWKAEDLIRMEAAGVVISLPTGATRGEVQLYRPSDASLDRRLTLDPDAAGRAVLPVAGLAAGLWRVRLEWRQAGRVCFKERDVQVTP